MTALTLTFSKIVSAASVALSLCLYERRKLFLFLTQTGAVKMSLADVCTGAEIYALILKIFCGNHEIFREYLGDKYIQMNYIVRDAFYGAHIFSQ